jgi:HK97 gp10 family phage protein
MGITARVEGLEELQAKLDALPTKLARRVLRPALEDAGAIIQQAIGIAAPRLQGSTENRPEAHEPGFLGTHIVVDVTVHNDLSADVKVGPSTEAWYGLLQEIGVGPHEESSPRGTKSYMHPGQPPRPFVRPAFASCTDEYFDALISNIRDGLDEVAGER